MNYELSGMCQSGINVLPLPRFLAKRSDWQSFCLGNWYYE